MSLNDLYRSVNEAKRLAYPWKALTCLIDKKSKSRSRDVAVLAGDQQQNYGQLVRNSDLIARYLIRQGIQSGDLVGVCCNRDINTPALLLGVMKSGAGYLPLDPDYPVERLAYMVEDAQVAHVLGNRQQAETLHSFDIPKTIIEESFFSTRQKAIQANQSIDLPAIDVDQPAYVIYTSGSTGKPKGVLVPHRCVVNMLWSLMNWPGFGSADRILATTTLSFDISVVEMFLPLVAGGSVAVVDRATAKDPVALIDAIRRYDVSFMQATPAMWRMIVEADFDARDGLKFITAGEPLPRDLIKPLLDRCDQLWNLYGPTETTVYSSGAQIFNDSDRILIGKPVANTNVYILDENDQMCPAEVAGELVIGGDGVSSGYLNRPELNAEKFIQFNGERVYRTGDLARMTADGQLDHLGRIDNQIKFNGHRIELLEIDAALAGQPHVRQAAAVLREDQPGEKRLVGYLLAGDQRPDPVSIRQAIGKRLPDYMLPNQIVVVDEFPFTPSGKLDRRSFPMPPTERPQLGVEYLRPSTDQELKLAEIWARVLQVEKVGTQDNFFDLGGTSLLAVRAIAAMKQELGCELSSAQLFDCPTITSLLRLMKKSTAVERPKPRPRPSSGTPTGGGKFAIVGMAARMPGASSVDEFWENLIQGKESITFFNSEQLDSSLNPEDTCSPNYVAARGIIENADHFDAPFFRVPPRHADYICPQQRLMLELAWTAIEDAGIRLDGDFADNKIGVWAGTYSNSYYIKNLLTRPEIVRELGEFQLGAYNEKDYIATRVAYALNLKGPAINVNTACSTSLVALIQACQALDNQQCDAALAGGVSVHFPQRSGHLHQTGSIFSPDGHCRPFDAGGAGTLFSDGAGVVVVKRLADAIADQDRIYAVVNGLGLNNDGGQKASFSAPSIQGQAEAIAMAHRMAGIPADSVGYIEAHGTATPIGDPIELKALQTVFEAGTDQKQFCAIGSVKSNIGHTVAAAGVAGLIKAALSLYYEQIPPTLHYQTPNPEIDFANSPFYVCDQLQSWPRTNKPRRAGVSSFGVGGTNAHVLLQEAPELIESSTDFSGGLPVSIVPVSAKSAAALDAAVDQYSEYFDACATCGTPLSWSAAAMQNNRQPMAFRAAVVASDHSEAARLLSERPPRQFFKRKASGQQRQAVFMFPGQGAQYVRMGQNLYEHSAIFKDSLDRCADILTPLLGRDLRKILFPSPDSEDTSQEILKNTRFTQPALFSLGYSLAQMWLTWGVQPVALMGHSIGEFAAACVADVFNLEDGLAMIAQRGRAMQALPGGSMISVGLPGNDVQPLLFGSLAVGAYNGPKLCVVAGPDDEVAELQRLLAADDVVCRHLHTSHAFHSSMMDSIVDPFRDFVAQFDLRAPRLPIVSTVTGDVLVDSQATDAAYWAKHLREPVRFSSAVTRMWSADETGQGAVGNPDHILIELGPRWTLATLARQHAVDPQRQIALPSLGNAAEGNQEWKATMNAVAQLWTAGVDIDWQKLTADGSLKATPQHLSLPTYPFQRKQHFVPPGEASRTSPGSAVTESTSGQTSCRQPINTNPSNQVNTMNRIPKLIEKINEIFAETSGFDLTEFDSDTTFFEMGLDSLVLTQAAVALKKGFDYEITFRQLLEETPTVDSLAKLLDQNLPVKAESVEANTPATLPTSAQATCQQVSPAPETLSGPVAMTHAIQPLEPMVGNNMQAIVQNQLQLMSAQLQILAGQSIATPVVTQANVVQANAQPDQVASVAPPTEPIVDDKQSAASAAVAGKQAKRFSTVKTADEKLDAGQQASLDDIIAKHNAMTPKSKQYAQTHRQYLADPRTVSGFRPNMKEMTHPIVIERSQGVQLWDIDGNQYIDFTCGFGSNILGHTHPATVAAITEQVQRDYAIGPQSPLAGQVAKLFCEITGNQRMAFSNTGSEAVLGCTRLARNATGRDLIVMFNGDYHGILDEVIARGSKKQQSFPAATGIPKQHVANTLILDYGDPKSLEIIRQRLDEIAAVLVEPVQSRTPERQPKEFLQQLRQITENDPACLIFDEVITGLRIGLGGAQEHFGVRADLAAYGKIVGGGMPIGIVAGKAEYMDGLDGGFWQYGDDSRPEAGMTYFAGTFVRHPLTLAASKAVLEHLQQGGVKLYDRLNRLGDYLADQLNAVFKQMDAPLFLGNFGSLFKIQFEQELVYSELFFAGLRRRGMHIWDHRPCLLTLAHDETHVDRLVQAMRETIAECQRFGFMPGTGYRSLEANRDADQQQAATQSVTTTAAASDQPPQPGAQLGIDERGKPGWFIADAMNPGQFIQVGVGNP